MSQDKYSSDGLSLKRQAPESPFLEHPSMAMHLASTIVNACARRLGSRAGPMQGRPGASQERSQTSLWRGGNPPLSRIAAPPRGSGRSLKGGFSGGGGGCLLGLICISKLPQTGRRVFLDLFVIVCCHLGRQHHTTVMQLTGTATVVFATVHPRLSSRFKAGIVFLLWSPMLGPYTFFRPWKLSCHVSSS